MISVIIPAFNSEKTIARALNSVLEQTYKDIEIIVVDDGSTDGTGEVVRGYGDKVKYKYQKNTGPAVARNESLKMAQGSWIAFLDSDDIWLPSKLKKQIELLDRNPNLKWCCTNRYQSNGERRTSFGNEKRITKALAGKDYFESYFAAAAKEQCPIITTCLIVHNSIFDELGDFDSEYLRGQDIDMWWRIAHKYPQIGYIAEPLATRYLNDENPVTKQRRLKAMNGEIGLKLLREHLNIAKHTESGDDFVLFSAVQLKQCLAAMVFCGYAKMACLSLKEFGELLPIHWHLFLKTSSVSPKAVSCAMEILYKIILLLKFKKKISRSNH